MLCIYAALDLGQSGVPAALVAQNRGVNHSSDPKLIQAPLQVQVLAPRLREHPIARRVKESEERLKRGQRDRLDGTIQRRGVEHGAVLDEHLLTRVRVEELPQPTWHQDAIRV